MALQPCSQCLAGDHAGCDAAARPFCGCRKADPPHSYAAESQAPDEPVEAPMDEVLDAATRAPRSAVAEEQEAVAATEGAVAPVVQDAPAVDPLALAGIDPDAQAAAVVGRLEGVLPPLPGPSDDPEVATDELDELGITPGVVGLVDIAAPDAVGTASDTPAPASPDRPIIMAEPRDPRLHVSIWDGPRAASADEQDFANAIEAELLAQHGADVAATGAVPDSFAEELRKAMDADEHGYAGTDAMPYACRCGKVLPSLNKLGSHLGLIGSDQAMAELGKLTVPHQLAQAKAEREALPPADDTAKESPGTGEPMTEVDQLTDDEGASVEVTVEVETTTEHVDVILPGTNEVLTGELTTTPVPPIDPEVLADLAAANAADMAAEGIDVSRYGSEPATNPDGSITVETEVGTTTFHGTDAQKSYETWQGAIQGGLASSTLPPLPGPSDEDWPPEGELVALEVGADGFAEVVDLPEPLADPSPVTLIVVDGTVGRVYCQQSGVDLPSELADAVLEHFGHDPTPLDLAAQQALVAPAEGAEPLPVAVPAGLTGRSLESTAVATPTRIQVAHFTTHCGQCPEPIEAGQMIGHLDGQGWVHLNH